VFYRQYDGYPEGHGTDLLTFIDNMESRNGMGCLAAQVISHFKEETGKFYLYSAGTRDIGEEFIYTLYYKNDELKIKVQDTYDKGHDLFDGNMTQYNEWINNLEEN
jgi:hypothetical protein